MIAFALLLTQYQGVYATQLLGERLLAKGEYQKASETFLKASALYTQKGDPNTAKIMLERSRRYATTMGLYVREPVSPPGTGPAKFEPLAGCYLGANIEREEATSDPQAFNNLVQKHHAMFFRYRSYGVPFPVAEARYLSHAKSALQIAFEPKSLRLVRDDRYLNDFAEACRASGIPIFLRFASEFNGSWTPYHGDPDSYKYAFRLVADVMHRVAPNVAMVWCPNEIPEDPINDYYPGADAVDWVGVNFYAQIYNDADRSRGAEWRWPTDQIDYVYRKYSARHPMMVGEWAATHRSTVDNRDRPDFAERKIQQFYRVAPLLYPRLKAVNWLSFNALKYAQGSRQLNNYSLYDNPAVAQAYRLAVTSDDYYLDHIGDASPFRWRKLKSGESVSAGAKMALFVRSYEPDPTVDLTVGGKSSKQVVIGRTDFDGPSSAGSFPVRAVVRDQAGRVAGKLEMKLAVLR